MGRGRGLRWVAVVKHDATVDASRAYLYGRFFMDADRYYSLVGKQSMALVIRCKDHNRYKFGSRSRGVQVLEVAPSRCWFAEVIAADQDGMIRKRVPVARSLKRPLDFAPGHAY